MVTRPVRELIWNLSRPAPWLALLLLAGVSLAHAQVRTVATPTVEPAAVRIGVADKVRIWADISDPNVIAAGVNLLKMGAPGTSPTVVGVLKDDGTGGDEIAGDGRFTIELAVNEPAARTLLYRISAPFKGTLRRTLTPDLPLAVVANRAPTAVPGAHQAVRTGALVQLDGRASFDLDGDLLRFRWTLTPPAGSAAVLDSTSHVKPSFSADRPGRYRAELVVNDGKIDSVVKEVTVDATDGNAPPTAQLTTLGLPFGAALTASVPLVGSGSDPENQPLTYNWALKAKPATSTNASLSALNGPPPQLLADKPGRYLVELAVSDGSATSAPVQALITLYKPNTPPMVNVGADPASKPTGSLVVLQGGASDGDNDSLVGVHWAFIARPANSNAVLANAATLTPGFTADQPGDYLLEMSATDSRGATGRARVVVRAITLPPVTITSLVANPGSGTVPLTVNFLAQASGGTGSFGYGWTFGDNGSDNQQNPQHVYTNPGTYIATVTATDSSGQHGTAERQHRRQSGDGGDQPGAEDHAGGGDRHVAAVARPRPDRDRRRPAESSGGVDLQLVAGVGTGRSTAGAPDVLRAGRVQFDQHAHDDGDLRSDRTRHLRAAADRERRRAGDEPRHHRHRAGAAADGAGDRAAAQPDRPPGRHVVDRAGGT